MNKERAFSLRLMAVNPTTLFCYWEVDSIRKRIISEHFQARWEDVPKCLLLHEQSSQGSWNVQRRKVVGTNQHLWIESCTPSTTYIAELAVDQGESHYFTILQSQHTQTPPSVQPSDKNPLIQFGYPAIPLPQVQSSFTWMELFNGYSLIRTNQTRK